MIAPRSLLTAVVTLGIATAQPHAGGRTAPRSVGVIPNSDFESGKASPWVPEDMGVHNGPDPTQLSIVSPGHNSQHAAKLGSASIGYGLMSTWVQVGWGTNYTLELDYQVVEAPSPACQLEVKASDRQIAAYDQKFAVNMTAGGDWQTASLVWPNYQRKRVWLSIQVSCPDSAQSAVLLDNINMTPTGSLVPGSCAGSPTVSNGDFEGGSIAPWQTAQDQASSFSIAAPGDNSSHALQLAWHAGDAAQFEWWQDVRGMCFNYYYSYSFALNWLNYSAAPPPKPQDGCQLSVSAFECHDDDLFIPASAGGWQTHSFNCTAKRDHITMIFTMQCGNKQPTQPWSLQMDNVAINLRGGPAPSPPTGSPTPSPSPSPTPASNHKRADQLLRPRWA